MSNRARTIYIGVTNDIKRRLSEHVTQTTPGFVQKYHLTMLVHVEEFTDIRYAIRREKQLKGWLRKKKIALIEKTNPSWADLSDSM